MQYLCRCSAAFIGCLLAQTSCFCCAYACMSLPPNYICQMARDLPWEKLFLLLFYLRWGGAPPSLTLPSHLSHPLIHLPPLCSVSLPPTTHHLLRPIITRSTSPLQLPWQQLCWAQVPMSPAVTSLPLTINIFCIKIKLTDHFSMWFMDMQIDGFAGEFWSDWMRSQLLLSFKVN